MERFEVFWTDCEQQQGWTWFDNREEAESFAQLCHELGDTNIRIYERSIDYV